MAIQPIQSSGDNGMLSTVVTDSAIGAGLGYVSKYMLPVTDQERDADFKKFVKLTYMQNASSKADTIAQIRNIKSKSLAQDTFIKMIDNKENKKITKKLIKENIEKLGGEKSVDAIEFKNIIANLNKTSRTLSKNLIRLYETSLKKIRPTAPFVTVGAIAGLFVGVAQNVLKTNTSV